jgi:hypothetical protein
MKHTKGMKQPKGTRIADTRKLQEIMHYHGLEQFQQLLREAYFNASDEMEDLDIEASEAYRDLANSIDREGDGQ